MKNFREKTEDLGQPKKNVAFFFANAGDGTKKKILGNCWRIQKMPRKYLLITDTKEESFNKMRTKQNIVG